MNEIEFVQVPAGCTDFLQPLDVCINKPLKDKVREFYVEWLMENYNTETFMTKGGYLRAPELDVYLGWVMKGLSLIENEVIKNSFHVCGVSWGIHENVNLNRKLKKFFDELVDKVNHRILIVIIKKYIHFNERYQMSAILIEKLTLGN
jgi:hypothetical protein